MSRSKGKISKLSPRLSEDRLIDWLRRRLRRQGEDLLGDDAALLERRERWAVSVDQQIEGVHFPLGLDPRAVGRRLVAVCLSDLAASGAQPAYCFLTVALPPAYPAKRLLGGILAACARHGMVLAGGDTAAGSGRLACTLTVLGRQHPRGKWLRRRDARPGDGLWLGGTVGESALGRLLLEAGASLAGRSIALPDRFRLPERWQRFGRRAVRRHLEPEPQLELGRELSRRPRVAAVDVSDGLAIDLDRLCRASGVGAELERAAIPVPPELERWSGELGTRAEDLCLAGGEDYVLLFTLPAGARRPRHASCRRIGSISSRPGVRLRAATGTVTLAPRGWDHLAR